MADLGLDPGLFPPILASGAVLGGLLARVAARVGLAAGLPVVVGGADSQACALGAGVVDPGPVSEMAGSSTCLNAAVPAPLDVLAVTHYPHVVPGPYTTETGINTTGAAVAWLAGLAYGGRSGRPTAADYARLDAEAGAVPPGADGVVALPVLGDGERTDPDLRGAVAGLSLRHGRAALARAILEGRRVHDRRPARAAPGRWRPGRRAARVRRRYPPRVVDADQGRRRSGSRSGRSPATPR